MTTIIIKNSSTSSAVPVSGDLTKGELAVNVTDKKLYTKDNGGSVVKLVGGLGNQEASAVAITGGAIDGTPIGGTTASTASFTTLSASGNVTLSGGTANGVLYLNGSKVATSGSALTFDGTNFGLGTSSPTGAANYSALVINGSTGGWLRLWANGTAVGSIFANAADGLNIETATATPLIFKYNGSEGMRVTSTGLGIGTSIPSTKLHVAGAGTTAVTISNSTPGTSGSPQFTRIAFLGYNGEDRARIEATDIAGSGNGSQLRFYTANTSNVLTQVGVFDSSGNLGLGVTPSAWSASWKVLENQGGFVGANSVDGIVVANNSYSNGTNWIYKNTKAASQYFQLSGAHQWYTAPSGTAGDAITFTQAMTLTAGGNLALGTTSPTEISNYVSQTLNGTSGSFTEYRQNGANTLRVGSDSGGGFIFTQSTTAIKFGTNDVERARIDSSGNLLVGKTSSGAASTAGCEFGTYGAILTRSSGDALLVNRETDDGAAVTLRRSNVTVGTISVTTSATSYNTSSDYRLKENQQPLTGSGAFIDALQPKTWNWKSDGSKGVGFIAHEVQAVSPGSVVGEKDGEQMQAMEYGSAEFIANIIAELQSLRARVAQLESN